MGREGPGLPVSWAGGWRKPIRGRRRWSGGSGSFPPGTLAAPSSVLRVHLTPADLPPRPIAKVGDSWAQGEEMGQRTQSSDRGARLGDNCSYYSELRLNQAQPPARLGDALLTGWRWMEVPLSPILPPLASCQTRGQLLSRQDGHAARHPGCPSCFGHCSPAVTITRLDINNSLALVYICLTS